MSNPTPWAPQSDPGSYFAGWQDAPATAVEPLGALTPTQAPAERPTAMLPGRRRSRNRIPAIVAAAVLIIAVIVGGFWLTRSSRHTLSTPATVSSYQLLHSAHYTSAQQASIVQQLGAGLKDTTVGMYGTNGSPEVIVGAGHATGDVDITFQNLTSQITPNSTTPLSPVSAGKLGGLMECTIVNSGKINMPTCVWHDEDTIGVVTMYGPPAGQAPKIAVEFRDAIEH